MASIGELFVDIKADTTQINKQIDNLGKSIESSVGGKALSSFERIKEGALSVFAGIGLTRVTEGFINVGKSIINLGKDLEQTTVAFSTMLGSAELAKSTLNDLSNFASKTPFTITGVRESAKLLLAMGVDVENLIPTMKALGDVAAGLSVPMDRLALAYGQVLAKGRLQGGELKQFVEAGVPLISQLATNLGVADSAIAKMVETGQISARDVTQAFVTMSSEGGRFANLMDAQSKTFGGVMSNISDIITRMGEQIGTALVPQMTQVGESILSTVGQFGESLGSLFSDGVSTVFRILGTAVSGITQYFNLLIGNTNKAADQQISFVEIVAGAFKALIIGVKVVTNAISGVGSLVGTALGVAYNNLASYITSAINVGISAINKLTSALNNITGTSFKQIDLFKPLPKLNIVREIVSTAKDVGAEFAKIDYSLGLAKSKRGVSKLIGEINLNKISDTGKEPGGSKSGSSDSDKNSKQKADELKKQTDDFNTGLFNAVKQGAEKARQEFDKIIDKIKSAKKELEDINTKIKDLDTDTQSQLSQRFLEIRDTIAQGGSNAQLEAELQKIQSIVPESVLQEASRVASLSTTDKILEDAEKARLKLEADKAIKEAEIAQLEKSKIDQQTIIDRYAQAQIDAEKSLTSKLSVEKIKQIKIYEDYVKTIENLNARLSSANIPTVSSTTGSSTSSVTNNYNVNVSGNGINGQSIANNLGFLTS